MDYGAVLHSLLPGISANISHTGGNASVTDNTHHAKAVESILALVGLRGLAPIYGFIGGWLGFEPSNILAVVGVLWALNKILRQAYSFLYRAVTGYFMCSVHILNNDDIYTHLMDWLATHPRMANSRDLVAETASKRVWQDEDASNVARDRSGRYLNFSNQEARAVSTLIIPSTYIIPIPLYPVPHSADLLTPFQATVLQSCRRPAQLLVARPVLPVEPQAGVDIR